MKVTVRVGDDLISDEPDDDYFTNIIDGGMLEFLPRNNDGFQDELLFRYDANLPFVSGSVTAHEGCAIAAHNARKIKVVEKFKEHQALVAEREAGLTCGRTLELGTDSSQKLSFWHFNKDLESLFVCQTIEGGGTKWHKFSDPEVISSVIVSLGKDPIVGELKRTFPKAATLIRGRKWSELLLKRRFKQAFSESSSLENEKESTDGVDESDPVTEVDGNINTKVDSSTEDDEVCVMLFCLAVRGSFVLCCSF
jgi:hypothetical protein